MKKFICFIVVTTLALINFSAFAGNYEFRGDNYRSYHVNSKGEAYGDPFYSYVDFKIVVNTDYDYVTVQVNHDKLYKFDILDQKAYSDPFKGIYFYCSENITINLYTTSDGEKHIMLKAPKVTSIFDL